MTDYATGYPLSEQSIQHRRIPHTQDGEKAGSRDQEKSTRSGPQCPLGQGLCPWDFRLQKPSQGSLSQVKPLGLPACQHSLIHRWMWYRKKRPSTWSSARFILSPAGAPISHCSRCWSSSATRCENTEGRVVYKLGPTLASQSAQGKGELSSLLQVSGLPSPTMTGT